AGPPTAGRRPRPVGTRPGQAGDAPVAEPVGAGNARPYRLPERYLPLRTAHANDGARQVTLGPAGGLVGRRRRDGLDRVASLDSISTPGGPRRPCASGMAIP